MSKYAFTVKKTYHYNGYPETEEHYEVKGLYFTANLKYYGNHGFDVPTVSCKSKNNGFFWSSKLFMKALYNDSLRKHLFSLKEGETITFELTEGDV